MDNWLRATCNAMADAAGIEPVELDLSPSDEATILDLARIAAHDSGERTNAPLLCYLVGRTVAGGAGLESIADAVRRST
jgi:hypothetical protein